MKEFNYVLVRDNKSGNPKTDGHGRFVTRNSKMLEDLRYLSNPPQIKGGWSKFTQKVLNLVFPIVSVASVWFGGPTIPVLIGIILAALFDVGFWVGVVRPYDKKVTEQKNKLNIIRKRVEALKLDLASMHGINLGVDPINLQFIEGARLVDYNSHTTNVDVKDESTGIVNQVEKRYGYTGAIVDYYLVFNNKTGMPILDNNGDALVIAVEEHAYTYDEVPEIVDVGKAMSEGAVLRKTLGGKYVTLGILDESDITLLPVDRRTAITEAKDNALRLEKNK